MNIGGFPRSRESRVTIYLAKYHKFPLCQMRQNTSANADNVLSIRVFQLEHYCAGRVVAKRRIETKRVPGNSRSLGFDTLRYSTGVR